MEDVVEAAEGDFDVGKVGLGVAGDEGGGELSAAEVEVVDVEVAVHVGLGLQHHVAEGVLGGDGGGEASFVVEVLLKAVLRFGEAEVLGECLVVFADEAEVGLWVEERPDAVVQRLPVAVAVDAAPRGHGPTVVELPEEGAHAAGLLREVLVDAVAHAPGLEELADVAVVIEREAAAIDAVVLHHGFVYYLAAAAVLLVAPHGGGVDVSLLFGAVAADGAVVGVALEAEFGHEAPGLFGVHLEGLFAPPDAPVVAVAVGDAFGVSPAVEGRGGDVGAVQGVVLPDGLGEDAAGAEEGVDAVLELGNLLGRPLVLLLPAPVFPAVLDLVVATPEDDAGVLCDAAHLLQGFLADVVEEGAVGGVEGAGEVEVLPHHDAQRVAEVVEEVGLVDAAAPDAEHVEVGLFGGGEKVAVLLLERGGENGEGVARYPVGALGKEGLSVLVEGEGLADGVGFLSQLDVPRLDLRGLGFGQLAIITLQLCRLGDAHGAQLGAPVPAQHVGRHAGDGAVVGQVARLRAAPGELLVAGEARLVGALHGVEEDFELQVAVDNGEDVAVDKGVVDADAVLAEHVVGTERQLVERLAVGGAVEIYLAEGGALEDELAVLKAFELVVRDGGAVAPHAVADPLHGVFVGAVEGVGDDAGGHEVGVDAAGDGGGKPGVVVLDLPVGEVVCLETRAASYEGCHGDEHEGEFSQRHGF